MSKSYEHFSKGDTVRIGRAWRSPGTVTGVRAFKDWIDHPVGMVGTVRDVTNAGFRGLEYTVSTDEGYAYGIGAGELELVEAVPVRPWPGQGTYRDGKHIGPA